MASPARQAAGRINGLKSGQARATTPEQARWKAAERRRRNYWAAVAEGACVDCGQKADAGVRCDDCREEASARSRAYYRANADARKAYQRTYYARKAAA